MTAELRNLLPPGKWLGKWLGKRLGSGWRKGLGKALIQAHVPAPPVFPLLSHLQHAFVFATDLEMSNVPGGMSAPETFSPSVSTAVIEDRGELLKAVQSDGLALRRASDELKADPEMVLAALGQNGTALQYAAQGLKGDGWFMLAALEQVKPRLPGSCDYTRCFDPLLQHVGGGLVANPEFMHAVVAKDGHALRFASEELLSDRHLVQAAVRQSSGALEHASDALKADGEFMLDVLKTVQPTSFGVGVQVYEDGCFDDLLKHAADALLGDPEFMRKFVQRDGKTLKWASPELRSDRDLVEMAVANDGFALQHACEELKADVRLMCAAVHSARARPVFPSPSPGWLDPLMKHAPETLVMDHEFMLATIQRDAGALKYASDTLTCDRSFMLAVIQKNARALEYASPGLRSDREFVTAAVLQVGGALQHASREPTGRLRGGAGSFVAGRGGGIMHVHNGA